MRTKLSVTLVALSMCTIGILGVVAALPPYFPNGTGGNEFGPKINTTCGAEQLGFGGNADGTNGNDYHRYINDQTIGILDSCVNIDGIVACVAFHAQNSARSDLNNATTYLTVPFPPSLDQIQGGIDKGTRGAGNLYQDECGGLLGSGTDGEWDYGSAAALLNVRSGSGVEPGTSTSGGDGIDICLDPAATAHHGGDTTIYVKDVVMGGSIGFTVSADWQRPATLSDDHQDNNNFPGTRHCGDGAIEPCTVDGHAGWQNEILSNGTLPTTPPNLPPANNNELNEDLDVIFGCNPLDRSAHVDPAPLGTAVNSFTVSSGTLSGFGNGGAAGWLQVFLDTGSEAFVCYDLALGCPVGDSSDDVPLDAVGVYDAASRSVPTAGWIWSGS